MDAGDEFVSADKPAYLDRSGHSSHGIGAPDGGIIVLVAADETAHLAGADHGSGRVGVFDARAVEVISGETAQKFVCGDRAGSVGAFGMPVVFADKSADCGAAVPRWMTNGCPR